MSENLLESMSSYITPDLISKASSMLGESENGISQGMTAAIPSLLGGLIGKADSSDFMDGIMNMVNQKGFDADSVLSDLPSLLSGKGNKSVMDSGGNMLQMLFGDNQSDIFDALANSAGIKSSSAKALMGMAAPLVLGYIKKSGFNASSLISSLLSLKKDIASMLPKEMNSVMGIESSLGDKVKRAVDKVEEEVKETFDKVEEEVKETVDKVEDSIQEKPKNKWMWPLIIIAAVLIIFYFMRNCSGSEAESPATNQVETEATDGIYAKATKAELDESYEVGINPDAETIAKFEERAGKKFSMYRAYDYDEEGWLSASWETDLSSAAKTAADHKAKTGHSTGVRWK
jgi:ElaB/YqjD/DUF883 family membrane-anchored ribosome-binding protein